MLSGFQDGLSKVSTIFKRVEWDLPTDMMFWQLWSMFLLPKRIQTSEDSLVKKRRKCTQKAEKLSDWKKLAKEADESTLKNNVWKNEEIRLAKKKFQLEFLSECACTFLYVRILLKTSLKLSV